MMDNFDKLLETKELSRVKVLETAQRSGTADAAERRFLKRRSFPKEATNSAESAGFRCGGDLKRRGPRRMCRCDREGSPGSVVVVGSINIDYVMSVERRPAPGETVGDAVLKLYPGGEGANRAVAAALWHVGRDGCSRWVRSQRPGAYWRPGSRGHRHQLCPFHGGRARWSRVHNAYPERRDAIAVAPGANAELTTEDVEAAGDLIGAAAVLVAQLEVPLAAVIRAAALAGRETIFLLNCAPYRPLPNELLEHVNILVVNESEAAGLLGRQFASVQEDPRGSSGTLQARTPLCRGHPGARWCGRCTRQTLTCMFQRRRCM